MVSLPLRSWRHHHFLFLVAAASQVKSLLQTKEEMKCHSCCYWKQK